MQVATHAPRHSITKLVTIAVPLGIASALTIIVFFYAGTLERDQRQLVFARQAETWAHTIDKSIHRSIEALYAIERLYVSSKSVERHEFQTFVAGSLARLPGIQALEWIPRVPAAQRAAYEATAQRQGFPTFQITERHDQGKMVRATPRAEYYPVYYVEPRAGNESAMGFDLASNPVRLAALHQARDTGRAVATARIRLVQERGQQFGFLVFVPVYDGANGPPHTVTARRQQLRGFVLGVFRIGDVIEASLDTAALQGLILWLEDETAPEEHRLLYTYPRQSQRDARAAADPGAREAFATSQWHTSIAVAGRSWRLHFTPTPAYLAAHQSWIPGIIFMSGLLFTGLLGTFLITLTNRTATIERLVGERTVELARSNHDLDQFAYVASHDLKAPLRAIDNLATWIAEDASEVLPENCLQDLHLLRQRVQRMERLLDDLLQYSRIGRLSQEAEAVDTNALVHEVVSLLDAPDTITVDIDHTLPLLTTSRAPLELVFRNLIGNAIKHHHAPNGHITVAAHHVGSATAFSVSDDGPGIAPAFHQQVFQMFQTLKPRDQIEGSGMGLALVKKTVETHGGTIELESTEDHGALFRFTWPRSNQDR